MSLKITFEALVNSLKIGDRNVPIEITLSDPAFAVENLNVADNFGTKIPWTTLDGGLTAYAFGLIISDQDLFVELRNTVGTPQFALVKVKAGVPTFIPGIVGATTTEKLDGAVLVSGTDFQVVDRIEVQRDAADGVGDATVDLYLFV